MNLGKLLGAGKSFVSGGKLAAYRADKRVYVPKFNAAKNPFTPATQPELPKPVAQKSVEPVKKPMTPSWVKTEKMPTLPTISPVAKKPVTTWTSRLNPVSLWRGGAQPETPAQIAARPVQTELSLEKVKVVQNDLSDAEVEVVPMKSRPPRATAPVVNLQPAKQSWEILGERMLDVKAF